MARALGRGPRMPAWSARGRGRSSRAQEQARQQQQAPAPEYEGMLQGVGNGVALGWAADRERPNERLPVALVVDGEIVAEGTADLPRPDLADLDLGDGAHGFLIALPERLQTPARRRIVALAGTEQVPLPAAPSFWHKPPADGAWSDVVFEPGGALSARVPDPPARVGERRAVYEEGWLFGEEEWGRVAASDAQMAGAAAALTDNARECAELGIAYIPALIPCKREVVRGRRQGGGRKSLAALRAALRDVDEVELLELLGVLRDCKAGGSPYHRTDADWNDRGAFFVARALLKEAHKRVPALRPHSPLELHLRPVPGYRGTLADAPLLSYDAQRDALAEYEIEVRAEEGIALDPSRLRALRMPVERELADAGETHLRVYATPEQDEQARVTLVGDGAALSLLPWLAERTSRTTFFWARALPWGQLEVEQPRVVVHLLREWDLPQLGAPKT